MIWITIIILAVPFFYAQYKKEQLENDSKQAIIDTEKHLKKISEKSNNL